MFDMNKHILTICMHNMSNYILTFLNTKYISDTRPHISSKALTGRNAAVKLVFVRVKKGKLRTVTNAFLN